MYGCQLRRDQNGRWNIIEAGDGEVLGNAELMGQSSFDHPDGQTVARGQDRGRAGLALKCLQRQFYHFLRRVGAFPIIPENPRFTGVGTLSILQFAAWVTSKQPNVGDYRSRSGFALNRHAFDTSKV